MNQDFRTKIEINKSAYQINHSDNIFLLGSCFTENLSTKLKMSGFSTNSNYLGVVYNPLSIANSLKLLLSDIDIEDNDLICNNNYWLCLYTNTLINENSKDKLIKTLKEKINTTLLELLKSDYIILTFGTAWVYRFIKSNKIVSNCHKLDSKLFSKELLSVENIIDTYNELIKSLLIANPNVKIIFTISPIRHFKDGAFGNQVSKSTLFLSIASLLKSYSNIEYFPSYEIFIDELRDYRFYADDMLHPSIVGIEYVWKKFSEAYFNDETINVNKKVNSIYSFLNHKTTNREQNNYKDHLAKIVSQTHELKTNYPKIYIPPFGE